MNIKSQQELDAEKERFEYMALHDPLTGLPNRKLFSETLTRCLARTDRQQTKLALLWVDLNGFKPINDQYEHDVGDEILVHVAKNMERTIRKNDLAARLGGDEFALIIEDIKSEDIEVVTTKVLNAIALPLELDESLLKVTASIGVAIFPDNTKDKAELIKQADTAMYPNESWAFMPQELIESPS